MTRWQGQGTTAGTAKKLWVLSQEVMAKLGVWVRIWSPVWGREVAPGGEVSMDKRIWPFLFITGTPNGTYGTKADVFGQ